MTRTVVCHVLSMATSFDVILGQTYLTQRRAVLNYNEKVVTLFKDDKCVHLRPGVGRETAVKRAPEPLLLSALQLKRAVRKAFKCFMVQVLPSGEITAVSGSTTKAQVDALLREFADVCQGLPAGLPPERRCAHVIPLVPGAKPPFRPMYSHGITVIWSGRRLRSRSKSCWLRALLSQAPSRMGPLFCLWAKRMVLCVFAVIGEL